jgi:hypothetical protein
MKKMLLEVRGVLDKAGGRYREVKLLTLDEGASFGGCEVAWWL